MRVLALTSSLQAFESAARTGDLAAAACELSVTQAVVAARIREIEARLGVALVVRTRGLRSDNVVQLTGMGRELACLLGAWTKGVADFASDLDVRSFRALARRGQALVARCDALGAEEAPTRGLLDQATQLVSDVGQAGFRAPQIQAREGRALLDELCAYLRDLVPILSSAPPPEPLETTLPFAWEGTSAVVANA